MVHEFTQVRAGVLRVIRHLLRVPRDLQVFNELQLSQLLCRSLDILLDNEEERIQALKLVSNSQRILSVCGAVLIDLVLDSENVVTVAGNHKSNDCSILGVIGRKWCRGWRSNVTRMFGHTMRIRSAESGVADRVWRRQCDHTERTRMSQSSDSGKFVWRSVASARVAADAKHSRRSARLFGRTVL